MVKSSGLKPGNKTNQEYRDIGICKEIQVILTAHGVQIDEDFGDNNTGVEQNEKVQHDLKWIAVQNAERLTATSKHHHHHHHYHHGHILLQKLSYCWHDRAMLPNATFSDFSLSSAELTEQ